MCNAMKSATGPVLVVSTLRLVIVACLLFLGETGVCAAASYLLPDLLTIADAAIKPGAGCDRSRASRPQVPAASMRRFLPLDSPPGTETRKASSKVRVAASAGHIQTVPRCRW